MTRVALVGSTGGLGRLIGSALLDLPDVQLRLLVRPGSEDKAAALQARGAELVTGDIAAGGEAALTTLCEGVDAVVSAVQGGPDVIVDGQQRLLQAARDAAVRRFVPSDYSLNLSVSATARTPTPTGAGPSRGSPTPSAATPR